MIRSLSGEGVPVTDASDSTGPLDQWLTRVDDRINLDGRLRNVEISQARTEETVKALSSDIGEIRHEVAVELRGIRGDIKQLGQPKPFPWAAVSALVAVFMAVETVAVLIFTR